MGNITGAAPSPASWAEGTWRPAVLTDSSLKKKEYPELIQLSTSAVPRPFPTPLPRALTRRRVLLKGFVDHDLTLEPALPPSREDV